MKLTEKITQYKKDHKNSSEHTFKDGTVVKAKLHPWIDNYYLAAVNEFKTLGTTNEAKRLSDLLK